MDVYMHGRCVPASKTLGEEVLATIQGSSGWENIQELALGQDGYVWRFVKGQAKPFIGWNPSKGYYAKEALGKKIAFEDSFFTLLNHNVKGAKATVPIQENYSIKINALPIVANQDANSVPSKTTIELKCGDDIQSLVNFNFPASKIFNWSPENCRDVVLRIYIDNLVLEKKYIGHYAFPKFIKDFPQGKRTFFSNDFPEQTAELKAKGIRYIELKYEFMGHEPLLLALKRQSELHIPSLITTATNI